MATAYRDSIDIGRVMQRGFSVIGRNAVGFLLASVLLVGVPNFLFQYLIAASPETMADGFTASMIGLYAALFLFTLFAGGLLQVTVVRSTILDLNGRPADIGGSLSAVVGLVLPVLGLSILSGLGIVFGFLLLIVPGLILMTMWMVAVPVLVEERVGIVGSLSRSAELTSGSRWHVFGLLVILWIVGGILGAIFGLFPAMAATQNLTLMILFQAVAATIAGVVNATMAASLYFELRTVKEGATADSLAAIFD